jgi:hypothetical protein
VTIHDYKKEMDEWVDKVLAEITDDSMNVHQKMTALSDYIQQNFQYTPWYVAENSDSSENPLVSVSNKIGPFFKCYVLESNKGPALLKYIGKKIGYDVNDDDVFWHGYVTGVFGGETYHYLATPYMESWAAVVPSRIDEIEYVDFSKY